MDEVLHGILDDQSNRISRLESAVRALAGTDRRQQTDIEGAVRNVGLVRYDAFEDVGGRLSFSCALLDDNGTGVVMTSINGQTTRGCTRSRSRGPQPLQSVDRGEEAIRQALEQGAERAVTAT